MEPVAIRNPTLSQGNYDYDYNFDNFPFRVRYNTTPEMVVEEMRRLNLNNQNAEEAVIAVERLFHERVEKAFSMLSQAMYSRTNPHRGMIESWLKNYILTTINEANDAQLEYIIKVANEDIYKYNPKMKDFLSKVNYAEKKIAGKVVFHLKKELDGVSPYFFLSGVGLFFSGLLGTQNENASDSERNISWIQCCTGACIALVPLTRAIIYSCGNHYT